MRFIETVVTVGYIEPVDVWFSLGLSVSQFNGPSTAESYRIRVMIVKFSVHGCSAFTAAVPSPAEPSPTCNSWMK